MNCRDGKWLDALNQRDITFIAYVLPSVIVVKMEINSQLEMFAMISLHSSNYISFIYAIKLVKVEQNFSDNI